MKKLILIFALALTPLQVRADFWGGDLPLLAEIVINTLNTLNELKKQSSQWDQEMAGINDRIERVNTINQLVETSTWHEWKDPVEATRRLQKIYFALPPEYRTEKYNSLERDLANAMNLAARLKPEAKSTFNSGKELERRGADASPGVAAKLSASGTGSLLTVQAQSLELQSHMTTLLTQMLASANEKETRTVAARGTSLKAISKSLKSDSSTFSKIVLKQEAK